jgi:hypothetical protein
MEQMRLKLKPCLGARNLMGENLAVVWAEFSTFEVGLLCFMTEHLQPLLQVENSAQVC